MTSELYAFFYNHRNGPYHIFSQWYPSKFVDNTGTIYHNAEQYMMIQKAALFQDSDSIALMYNESNPAILKKLGRSIKNFDEEIWKQHRYNIVFQGNYLKFTQNPQLQKILLDTKDKIIAEASPTDDIWGIGLREQVARKKNRFEWPGQNLLGKALMKVREELS